MKLLRGHVAVITGAASGMGRALSIELAIKGCHLALVDKNQIGAEETADLVKNHPEIDAVKLKITTHKVDVANRAGMEQLSREVLANHHQVNILINNAGITFSKTIEEHTEHDFDLMLGVNLRGVINGCSVFLPYLRQVEEAHIINISSMAGFLGIPTQSAYCMTKAAVRAFTESLWAELSGSNIGVTCVYPGAVRTNILRASTDLASDKITAEKMADIVDKFAMQPEKAAKKIVHAIERNKMRLLIGIDAYILELLKRIFPTLIHRIFGIAYRLKDRLLPTGLPQKQ